MTDFTSIEVLRRRALARQVAAGLAVYFEADGRPNVYGFSDLARRDGFIARARHNGLSPRVAVPADINKGE